MRQVMLQGLISLLTRQPIAWYACVNALFGQFKRFKVDYRVIPWATFVDPEVARVGLNEQDAAAQGISYQATRYGIDDLTEPLLMVLLQVS